MDTRAESLIASLMLGLLVGLGVLLAFDRLIPADAAGTRSTAIVALVALTALAGLSVWLVRELSRRRRAEAEVERERRRLERLLEAGSRMTYVLGSVDGRLQTEWVSANLEGLLGYDPSAAKQSGWWRDNLHPEDRDRALKEARRHVRRGGGISEYRFRDAGGEYLWIRDELRVSRREDGRIAEIVGCWFDVTEERERAEALLRSERQVRRMIDHAVDAVFVHDPEGRFLDVNRRACEALGYSRDRLLGMSISDIDAQHVPERSAAHWQRLRATGRPITVEGTHRRADGTTFPVEIRVSLFELDAGEVMVALARDVSDRRRAESEREALREQLRQAQKMEAIGQLAGGIAHDFNNLLTVIRGTTDLLLSESGHQDREDLTEIRHAADRAATLTRQLLAFGRKQMLRRQRIDLNEVVREAAALMRRTIGERIRLELELADEPCDVVADPSQLEQVLLNLGINARDAMPDGGTLSISTRTVVLEAKDAVRRGHPIEPGEYATICVTDTGVGMSADVQAKMFEPFYTTKPKGLGTGLGLSTVYGIVKQSGGYIWVRSRPGEGTELTVCLPRRPHVVTHERPSPRDPDSEPATRGTVLVVEDDDGVRTLVRRTLAAAGYVIRDARSPVEALGILEAEADEIDLMVSDIVMPDTSGPCLAAEASSRWPHLRLLYMSGYTGEVLERHGLKETDAPLLEKPFTGGELLDAIRKVLDAPPGLRVA